MHNHCFDVASKMKLCSPKSATGQEEQNKREPFTALAVCGAAHGERVFHSHSLLTTPFNDYTPGMPKKEAERSLRLFWSGLIVVPGFSPSFKSHWSRCLRLFKRPGRMGCNSLSETGGTSRVAQHRGDVPAAAPCPGASSRRDFPPSQVQTPLAGALSSCLGRGNGNHRGKRHTTRRRMMEGLERGLGWEPRQPNLPCSLGEAGLGWRCPRMKGACGPAGLCWQKRSWRGWICHLTQSPSS